MTSLLILLPATQVISRIIPNSRMTETAGAIIQQKTWREPHEHPKKKTEEKLLQHSNSYPTGLALIHRLLMLYIPLRRKVCERHENQQQWTAISSVKCGCVCPHWAEAEDGEALQLSSLQGRSVSLLLELKATTWERLRDLLPVVGRTNTELWSEFLGETSLVTFNWETLSCKDACLCISLKTTFK